MGAGYITEASRPRQPRAQDGPLTVANSQMMAPRVDVAPSRLSVAPVRAKIMDVATSILSLSETDVGPDTALMQVGMNSATSVMMRDAVAAEFPGVTLPSTLAYDFP